MHIDKIQRTNFQQKSRFIHEKTRADIYNLLIKMDREPLKNEHNQQYFLKSLSLNDGSTLYDNRTNLDKPIELALFDVGKKAQLVIDVATGNIIDHNKQFFSTWRSVLKNLTEITENISKNYDKQEIVKRNYLPYNKWVK